MMDAAIIAVNTATPIAVICAADNLLSASTKAVSASCTGFTLTARKVTAATKPIKMKIAILMLSASRSAS